MNDVTDNPTRHRFELVLDGHVATSEYSLDGGVISFMHTDVPAPLAGKGIGSRLIKGALAQVRGRGLKVVAQCPFVKSYLDKHAEYADLVK
jgi:uncharacterized protein